MKKFLGMIKARRPLILISAFTPLCFGALLAGTGSLRVQDLKPTREQSLPTSDIKVINKTTALDVTFETMGDNQLLVKVKNLSSKDMNGYVIGFNDARVTIDISIGDRVISTGETDDLQLPIRSSSMTLTILAAMFADGSIEAEPVLKKELSETRLGLKKELIRNLAVLDEILGSPDAYSTKALDHLEDKFSFPSNSHALSNSESGVQSARNSLNSELKSLRQRQQHEGSAMQIQRLLDLRGRLERRIARL